MEGIKNIIFDLGGVVVDLEIDRVREAFREIGMPRMAAMMDPCYPAEINERMECGELSWEEACDEMRRLDNRPEVTDEQIAWVYGEFLARVDTAKIERLEQLRREGYRLYVLSNTNRVAFEAVCRHFRAAGRNLEACFDEVFLSYRLKLLKPSSAIFEEVIRRTGIRPEETLFIDDGARNVATAVSLGFCTYCPPTNGMWEF